MNIFIAGNDDWIAEVAEKASGSGHTLFADKRDIKKLSISDIFITSKLVNESSLETASPEIILISNPLKKKSALINKISGMGIPIICRGPLGSSPEEAKKVLEIVKREGVKILVSQGRRYEPAYNQAAEQLEQGKIGELGSFSIQQTFRIDEIPRDEGMILDVMIDDLDWIVSELGPVKTVFAQRVKRGGKEPLEQVMVTLTLTSGVIGRLVNSCQSIFYYGGVEDVRSRLELCGTGGLIQLDTTEKSIEGYAGTGDFIEKLMTPYKQKKYDNMWAAFEQFLTSRAMGRKAAGQSIKALRLAQAVEQSIKINRPVNVGKI